MSVMTKTEKVYTLPVTDTARAYPNSYRIVVIEKDGEIQSLTVYDGTYTMNAYVVTK